MKWNLLKLGDLATISAGQSAPKEDSFNHESGLPFIRAGHLETLVSGGSLDTLPHISEDVAQRYRLKKLQKNSIVFAKSGMSATLNRVYRLTGDAYYVSHLASVHTDENKLDPRYCCYFLQKYRPAKLIKDESYPSIGLPDISNIKIPLPPLHIQQQIADTLGKADALRRKDQELLQKYDELAQSIFYDMFGDPVENELGWEVRSLNDLSEFIQIGPFGSLLHAEDYVSGGVPLVNPSHIRQGRIVPDLDHSVTEHKLSELSNYTMRQGDIVMGRRGEMGRCAEVTSVEDGWLCGTGSLFIRPNGIIITKVLAMFLSHPSVRDILEKCSLGTTMSNLNQKIVSNLKLVVPPKKVQEQFNISLRSLTEQMRIIENNVYQSDLLFQNLLNQNFQ